VCVRGCVCVCVKVRTCVCLCVCANMCVDVCVKVRVSVHILTGLFSHMASSIGQYSLCHCVSSQYMDDHNTSLCRVSIIDIVALVLLVWFP
jgi:hypothetical protein